MDGLSLDALTGQQPDLTDADRKIARAYIGLCEDQLKLRGEGWISNETWRIWSTGIAAQLERSPFRQVCHEINPEGSGGKSKPYGEFNCLRNSSTPCSTAGPLRTSTRNAGCGGRRGCADLPRARRKPGATHHRAPGTGPHCRAGGPDGCSPAVPGARSS